MTASDELPGAAEQMPPPPGPPPGPLGKPPGSAGGPPPVGGAAGPPPGSVARGVPGGGAKPKASAAPDWRNKLPATNAATTVMQVPAVSATGRTQWQPSSTFTPSTEPEPLSQPELEPEPEQEPGQPTDGSPEDEESDDEMFAAFADNYHRQVKQITPDVSPEKDTAVQLATEGSIAARDAAAAARGERAADLASGKQAAGAAGSGAVEDTLEEDAVVTSGNEISEEEAQRLAEEEAAATARAAAEDEEEEAAVEAADALDTPVALGFAENCDDFPHELDPEYFPSKIGGHAAWLHPMGIPVDKNRCPHCAAPMTFLLQIYTGGPGRAFAQPGAFHRTLFLYTCRSSACHARKPPVRTCWPGITRHTDTCTLVDGRSTLALVALNRACGCRTVPRSGSGARSFRSKMLTTRRRPQSTACTVHRSRSRNSPALRTRRLRAVWRPLGTPERHSPARCVGTQRRSAALAAKKPFTV